MSAPVIRQFVGSIPDKGQAQTTFDTNVDAWLDWTTLQFAPDLVAFGSWADQVRAALIAGNLPPLTGRQLDALRVNAAGNGVEFANVTAAGWALLDDADAAAQRVTLALQSINSEGLSSLDLGRIASGDRASFIDFHSYGAANSGVFAARLGRDAGTNGDFTLQNFGTGFVSISTSGGLNLNGAVLAPQGVAPLFACRAWVNFNGTGTVAIRASGNVSSITDNGVGDYTVNFTTAMQDANYAVVSTPARARTDRPEWVYHCQVNNVAEMLTTSVRLKGGYVSGAADGGYNATVDLPSLSVAIFR